MKESESRRLLLTSQKGIGAGFRTRQPCHLGGKSGERIQAQDQESRIITGKGWTRRYGRS